MAYRRTANVSRKLAARQDAIIEAARAAAEEGGMTAVQIAPIAQRAGIAAGTIYRYFPAKTELVGALVEAVAEQELAAVRRAADAAPGPLSAIAAAVTTFAARSLRQRRLIFAVMTETVDADVDAQRAGFRMAIAAEFETRISAALDRGLLPKQDAGLAAAAVLGALSEGLIGPLGAIANDAIAARDAVQMIALLALRGLGMVDAHARGLVLQSVLPPHESGN